MGASNDPSKVEPYLEKSLLVLAYAAPLLLMIAYLCIDPLTQLFLREYAGGAPAAKIYVFGTFFRMLVPVTYMICAALARTRHCVIHTLSIIALDLALTSHVLKLGAGLEGAALCYGVVHAVLLVLQLRLTFGFFGASAGRTIAILGRILLPWMLCTTVVLSLESALPLPADVPGILATSAARAVLGLVPLAILAAIANRRWRFADVLASDVTPARF